MTPHASLRFFHPLIQQWFSHRFPEPTEAQRLAWPPIANGENVLITAPTGSGKTLTAFLFAIDKLARRDWVEGGVRVLYVSPLRALNADIARNLNDPLEAIGRIFCNAGADPPDIRIGIRSGDTPARDRREMLRRPPEILITTPESLNILLTSKSGPHLFTGLTTVILDEVHAVAGSKRGTHLITAVERLARLSGAFQRIALSATVHSLETISRWVGGYEMVEIDGATQYRPRLVTVIQGSQKKKYDLTVTSPIGPEPTQDRTQPGVNPIWLTLAKELASQIETGGPALVFANSRRVVERLARLINSEKQERLVYSHHGSLSREIRETVESRLKAGELKGVVATNSLELGIDVGAIDEVLLVETPTSVSSAVQRIGRAGHQVGQTSQGRLYPLHPSDIIDAAVVVRELFEGNVEPLTPPRAPLDVLAQVILSMTATEEWPLAALFDFIRTAEPYCDLSKRLFDLVIDMLSGKYQGSRVPELRPRVAIDRISGTIRANKGVPRMIYASGGTIPDRGYYTLRLADTGAVVGTLDEEFVWERTVGETISLGVQAWQITRITASDVMVAPSRSGAAMAPFWRAEERFHSFWFAEKRGVFLKDADDKLTDPDYMLHLRQTHRFDMPTCQALVRFLSDQKAATGCALPHRHHVVIEHVAYPNSSGMLPFVALHTTWGGRVNRPLALALIAAHEAQFARPLEAIIDDSCVALEIADPALVDELLQVITPENLEQLVRKKLASTGFFGAHFRENATRALLLLKAGFGKRTPLWLNRQRAKELMGALSEYGDFPVVLETWRTCLWDEVDVAQLADLLAEMKDGRIAVTAITTTTPSPFAREILWKRTNALMYEDDVPTTTPARINEDLIREVVFSPHLRPKISSEIIAALTAKIQRTYPGYAPSDAGDLIEWVKERIIIPADEWRALLDAIARDWDVDMSDLLTGIGHRVVATQAVGPEGTPYVCAIEDIGRIISALSPDAVSSFTSPALDGSPAAPEAAQAVARVLSAGPAATDSNQALFDLLGHWLRYHGPLTRDRIAADVPVSPARLDRALSDLCEANRTIMDHISHGAKQTEVIDAENLARLLRMTRATARPTFEPKPAASLPLFLAEQQGLGIQGDGYELKLAMERLFGVAMDAALLEEEILPARLDPYRSTWLDGLLVQTDLAWRGCPGQKIAFRLSADAELFDADTEPDTSGDAIATQIFPSVAGRFSFSDLISINPALKSAELANHLWQLTWSGHVANDTFAAVRQGVATRFRTEEARAKQIGKGPRRARGRFGKWAKERPFVGNWYRLARTPTDGDALDEAELLKDRARVLIDRYGILFRELLKREAPPFRWQQLFRSLRLMELSGEVIGGSFFRGISGLQFISPSALDRLRDGGSEVAIFWMNATDPASACGLSIDGLSLPSRVPTTHLVFRGQTLAIIAKRRAKVLDIRVDPNDSDLPRLLKVFNTLLTRDVRPLRAITIEEINGEPAGASAYRPAFEAMFDTYRDHRALRIARQY
ncbi:MAG: DEAD/DEAH box helicase [Myxococcota bacterium]|nr:DEAD/DEAH box helicase [Myxococcota bacterium]